MFSNLDKEYIRSHFTDDLVGAIRYVRSKTGADFMSAKNFIYEVFDMQSYPPNYYRNDMKVYMEEIREGKINTQNESSDDKSNIFINIITFLGVVILSTFIWGIFLAFLEGSICICIEIIIFIFTDMVKVIHSISEVGLSAEIFKVIDSSIYISVFTKFITPYIFSVFIAFIYCFVKILKCEYPLMMIEKYMDEKEIQRERDKEERRKARIWLREKDKHDWIHGNDRSRRH